MFKKWIKIAKKYGAEFKNVDFLIDKDGYVKTVAIDKTKDAFIKLPQKLLIPKEAVEIYNDKHYVLEEFVKEKDLREMLNEYLNFIFSQKRVNDYKNLIKDYKEFPQSLKNRLFHFEIFFKDLSDEEIKRKLLQSSVIYKQKKIIFMPFIGLVNHSFEYGNNYDIEEKSITIKSKPSPSGEIFAIYNNGDSFKFLSHYYFPDNSIFAYSAILNFQFKNRKISIKRNLINKKIVNNIVIPNIKIDKNEINFPYFWIGATKTPRKPFLSIKKALNDREVAIELLSIVTNINIRILATILEEVDKIDNLLANFIKKAALNQLKVIGESFIDLEI